MIFRVIRLADPESVVFCDTGPYAGQWRARGYLYGERGELDALLAHRRVRLVVLDHCPATYDPPGPHATTHDCVIDDPAHVLWHRCSCGQRWDAPRAQGGICHSDAAYVAEGEPARPTADGGETSGTGANDVRTIRTSSPGEPADLRFAGAMIEAALSAAEIEATSVTAGYVSGETIVVSAILTSADDVTRALTLFDPLPPGAARVEHHISKRDSEFAVRVYYPRGDL